LNFAFVHFNFGKSRLCHYCNGDGNASNKILQMVVPDGDNKALVKVTVERHCARARTAFPLIGNSILSTVSCTIHCHEDSSTLFILTAAASRHHWLSAGCLSWEVIFEQATWMNQSRMVLSPPAVGIDITKDIERRLEDPAAFVRGSYLIHGNVVIEMILLWELDTTANCIVDWNGRTETPADATAFEFVLYNLTAVQCIITE
jgi:hypothetical protein